MNYKIDKFKVFESKEQYLDLRNKWKSFICEGKHKPYYQEYTRTWLKPTDPNYKEKVKISPLGAKYHLLYCLLLGKDLRNVLEKSPISDQFYEGLITMLESLSGKRFASKYYLESIKDSTPYKEIFEEFLTKERIEKILDELTKKPG